MCPNILQEENKPLFLLKQSQYHASAKNFLAAERVLPQSCPQVECYSVEEKTDPGIAASNRSWVDSDDLPTSASD